MNKSSRTKNSVRNITASMVSQVLLMIIRFVCRTVFISTLGKAHLGINGVFADIFTMLSLTELGLDTAMNFKLYKPLAENDTSRIRALMKFYKYAYIAVGSAVLVLGACIIPFLPNLIKDYDSLGALGLNPVLIYLLFLIQSGSSYLFFASRTAILKADQQEYVISVVGLVTQLGLNIAQIITLLVFEDFVIYTALTIVFSLLSNLIIAIISKKKYPEVFKKSDDKLSLAEIKELFKDLGAVFVYKANGIVTKATGNIILSTFIGITIVGLYSNYFLFYTTIKTVLAKFYSAIKASMGNLYAKGDVGKQYFFFEVTNFLTFILYGTAAVSVAVVADELLCCWIGADYVIAQPFSILLGIEILFLGIKTALDQIRNISGAFRQMWFRPVLGIIINLAVSIVSVQFIGIYGVILGTIVADITTNFLVDPRIIHKHSFKGYKSVSCYYASQIKYMILLFVIAAIDFVICKFVLVGYGWLSVIFHAIVCAVSVPLGFVVVFRKREYAKYFIGLAKKTLKISK